MHRPSIHVVEVQGSPAKVAVQSEHTGTLFHEGASFSTHNELYELSCAHAAALNATGPPVTYKPLCEYNNPEVASRQMEQHITNLAPDTVMDLALTLHRHLTAIAQFVYHTADAMHAGSSDSNPIAMNPHSEIHSSPPLSVHSEPHTPIGIASDVGGQLSSAGSVIDTRITNELARGRDEVGMKMVNQYTFLKELGRGRYGKVKLAIDDHEKMVAIKVVPHRYVEEQKRLASKQSVVNPESNEEAAAALLSPMEREVRVMSKLRHRNVIRLREVIDDPEAKHIYMVMDYAERGPLITVNPNGTSVPLYFDVAKGYMKQLGDGLHYLHKHNVVHRDIKPDNVLLSASGIVCFSDFGVSSFFSDTEFTYCEGTPAYHAPEICLGEKFRGPPTDVWALGVTFFMMVYGYQPFYSETASGLRKAIIEEPLQFPLYDNEYDNLLSMSATELSMSNAEASFASSTIIDRSALDDRLLGAVEPPKCVLMPIDRENGGPTSPSMEQEDVAIPTFDYKRFGGTPIDHLQFQTLLKGMLEKDPEKRLTIQQVRHYRFFKPPTESTRTSAENQTRVSKMLRSWDIRGDVGKMSLPQLVGYHERNAKATAKVQPFSGSPRSPQSPGIRFDVTKVKRFNDNHSPCGDLASGTEQSLSLHSPPLPKHDHSEEHQPSPSPQNATCTIANDRNTSSEKNTTTVSSSNDGPASNNGDNNGLRFGCRIIDRISDDDCEDDRLSPLCFD